MDQLGEQTNRTLVDRSSTLVDHLIIFMSDLRDVYYMWVSWWRGVEETCEWWKDRVDRLAMNLEGERHRGIVDLVWAILKKEAQQRYLKTNRCFGQQTHSTKYGKRTLIIACIARQQIQRKHAESIPSLESYKSKDKRTLLA